MDPRSTPGYIQLPKPNRDHSDLKAIHGWLYKPTLRKSRCVIIVMSHHDDNDRLSLRGQRAPKKTPFTGVVDEKPSEEPPPEGADVISWIASVMTGITLAQGIMKKVLPQIKY